MTKLRPLLPTAIIAVVATSFLTSPVKAAFTLFEDFEDVAVGSDISGAIAGENFNVGTSNATNSGAYTVITDPTNAANRLLQSTGVQKGFTGSLGALSIADGTTGTLFYRVYRLGTASATAPDFNAGLSDENVTPSPGAATSTGLYEAQLNTSGAFPGAQAGEFSPRDGTLNNGAASGFVNSDVAFTPGTFFGIFQVINNATDSVQYYYQRQSDGAPILLTNATTPADTTFNFRNTNGTPAVLASNALTNFLVLTSGAAATQDTFYLDDIYVDTSGQNLVAPVPLGVPEPTSATLLALGVLGFSQRRRRS